MIKVTWTASELSRFKAQMPGRLDNAVAQIGRNIAAQTAAQVKRLIPMTEWWHKLYRDSIEVYESSDRKKWAVMAVSAVETPLFPAETTLVNVTKSTGTSPDAPVNNYWLALMPYNPWPIDLIPALTTAYVADLEVIPKTSQEVAARRATLRPLIPTIRKALTDAGASLSLGGPVINPKFAGRAYVDYVFLAKRLELGLGGMPRKPHWVPAASDLQAHGLAWGNTPAGSVAKILETGSNPTGSPMPMSEARAKEFEDSRNTSWRSAT